jgi:hypothetical protein
MLFSIYEESVMPRVEVEGIDAFHVQEGKRWRCR